MFNASFFLLAVERTLAQIQALLRDRSRPNTHDEVEELSVSDLAGRLTASAGEHSQAPQGGGGGASSTWSHHQDSAWHEGSGASGAGVPSGRRPPHSGPAVVIGPVSNVVEEHLSVQRAKDVFMKAVNDSSKTASSAVSASSSFSAGGAAADARSRRVSRDVATGAGGSADAGGAVIRVAIASSASLSAMSRSCLSAEAAVSYPPEASGLLLGEPEPSEPHPPEALPFEDLANGSVLGPTVTAAFEAESSFPNLHLSDSPPPSTLSFLPSRSDVTPNIPQATVPFKQQ